MISMVRSIQLCLTLVLGLLPPALAAQICPLPEFENVSYQAVLGLEVEVPEEQIAYGKAPLQYAEFWPAKVHNGESSAPLVALIHGGCWLNAYDVTHTHALSTALARSGYHVWSLEYRRTGDAGGGWPGTFDDVLAGLNALAEYSKTPIDRTRIAIVGHSAGGHLGLLAAASERLSIVPALVLGLAPIVNPAVYAEGANSCQKAVLSFFAGTPEQKPLEYAAASPVLAEVKSNFLVLHGELDDIVPLSQTDSIPRQLVPGAGHFDFLHPSTPAFQSVLKALADSL